MAFLLFVIVWLHMCIGGWYICLCVYVYSGVCCMIIILITRKNK